MADLNDQVNNLFPELSSENTTKSKKDTAQLFGTEVGVSGLGSFFAGIGSPPLLSFSVVFIFYPIFHIRS